MKREEHERLLAEERRKTARSEEARWETVRKIRRVRRALNRLADAAENTDPGELRNAVNQGYAALEETKEYE